MQTSRWTPCRSATHVRRHAIVLAACLVAGLAACAPRGTISLVPDAADVGTVQDILVATTRAPGPASDILSSERSAELRYFSFGVSVPPDRAPGSVVFPNGPMPDPARHFLTTSIDRIPDEATLLRRLNAELARAAPDRREAVIYVHGFNNNFAEGLYRHAQISHDFGGNAVSISYAWPSAGNVSQYATDRESVLFARDGLESLMSTLARSNAQQIVVVAHSMGAHLVMETLRQMDIRGNDAFFGRLKSVVLFAPDIDLDVFRKQAGAIRRYDVPVFVFASNEDRALRWSSRLRRGAPRLGSVSDPGLIEDVPVFVVDLTRLRDGSGGLNHSKAANSPTMIALVNGLGSAGLEMFRSEDRRPTLLETGVLAVQGVGNALAGAPGAQ